jgi:hypothetical protein
MSQVIGSLIAGSPVLDEKFLASRELTDYFVGEPESGAKKSSKLCRKSRALGSITHAGTGDSLGALFSTTTEAACVGSSLTGQPDAPSKKIIEKTTVLGLLSFESITPLLVDLRHASLVLAFFLVSLRLELRDPELRGHHLFVVALRHLEQRLAAPLLLAGRLGAIANVLNVKDRAGGDRHHHEHDDADDDEFVPALFHGLNVRCPLCGARVVRWHQPGVSSGCSRYSPYSSSLLFPPCPSSN